MMKIVSLLLQILPNKIAFNLLKKLVEKPRSYLLKPKERSFIDQGKTIEFASGKYAYLWGEEGPLVVFMHGWGGAAGQWQYLIVELIKEGYRAVALDVSAHGRSKGNAIRFSNFSSDLLELLSYLKEKPYAIVGHSAGCLGMLYASKTMKIKTKIFICISSPYSFYPPIMIAKKLVSPSKKLIAQFKVYLSAQFNSDWEDLTKEIFSTQNDSQYLFVYDENDEYLIGDDFSRIKEYLPQGIRPSKCVLPIW